MYQIKRKLLNHARTKRNRLVIEFSDPKYNIIAEMLMTDASFFKRTLLADLHAVLDGEKEVIERSGNRTYIRMTKSDTTMEDLLIDYEDTMETYETVIINTEKLRTIVEAWFEAVDQLEE